MNQTPIDPPAWFFPNWPEALSADPSLTPGLREVYRRLLSGFMEFCRKRQTASSAGLRVRVTRWRARRSLKLAVKADWRHVLSPKTEIRTTDGTDCTDDKRIPFAVLASYASDQPRLVSGAEI